MSTFDAILGSLNEDNPYSPKTRPSILGSLGARVAKWSVDEIDAELVDADCLVDQFTQDPRVKVQDDNLLNEGSMDDDETWVSWEILIGNLDLEESACWGLLVDSDVMEDANFPTNASFTLMEGKEAVLAHLAKRDDAELQRAAHIVLNTMKEVSGGDPMRMLRLREHMLRLDGADLLASWDSVSVGKELDATTQPSNTSVPKRRM